MKTYDVSIRPSFIEEQNICENINDISDTENNFNSGKWTLEEHMNYLIGIIRYGNYWKEIQKVVKTRNAVQMRSHSQKFFLKIKKLKPFPTNKKGQLNVVVFHEYVKNLNKDEIKILLKQLIEAHEVDEEESSQINYDEVYEKLTTNKSSSKYSTKVPEENQCNKNLTSFFQNHFEINNFINLCEGASWMIDCDKINLYEKESNIFVK